MAKICLSKSVRIVFFLSSCDRSWASVSASSSSGEEVLHRSSSSLIEVNRCFASDEHGIRDEIGQSN